MSGEGEARTTDLPVPTGAADRPSMVVLMGGTFDPPHIGHIELPRRVRDELERRQGEGALNRGWLVYVPAACSPHKPAGPSASDADRLAMLRLAVQGVERCAVWTDEIDRAAQTVQGATAPASYTIDTLTRARQCLDERGLVGCPMSLLIGADQAAAFHTWLRPRDILRLAQPVVMIRGASSDQAHGSGDPNHAITELMRRMEASEFWDAQELRRWRDAIIPVGRMDVSSSDIRSRLARGDIEGTRAMLLPAVLEFIGSSGLYQRAV